MGGLAISTVLTTVLLPTTVCITEDVLGWAGRTLRLPKIAPRWIRGAVKSRPGA
jgi:hypothetical protein